MKKIAGRDVVQSDVIRDNYVVLLSNNDPGSYYIGPGPNGMYARVQAGDGCFGMAYFKALNEGRFTEDLGITADDVAKVMNKVQI
jgi:hypothetical protein